MKQNTQIISKNRIFIFGILILFSILFFCSYIVEAAEYYKVNVGTTVTINEHGVCKKVTNSGSSHIFVPTKTTTEWSEFRIHHPSNVYLGECCTNDCSYSGQKICCSNWGYKTCGNYDGDSCLEWSGCSSCGTDKCVGTTWRDYYCTGSGSCTYRNYYNSSKCISYTYILNSATGRNCDQICGDYNKTCDHISITNWDSGYNNYYAWYAGNYCNNCQSYTCDIHYGNCTYHMYQVPSSKFIYCNPLTCCLNGGSLLHWTYCVCK